MSSVSGKVSCAADAVSCVVSIKSSFVAKTSFVVTVGSSVFLDTSHSVSWGKKNESKVKQ